MAFRILVALTVTAGAVPTTLDPVVPIFCMITSVASHKAVSRWKILLPFSRYGPRRPAAVTAGDGDGNISIYGAWGLIIETSGLMVYAGDRPPASRAWRRCLPCCPSRYPVCQGVAVSPTGASTDLARKVAGDRKLIAVVYADMVAYSRLIGLDDAGTLARLKALRANLIDLAIAEHGGKLVQTGGDSLLIVFDSIDGAVRREGAAAGA